MSSHAKKQAKKRRAKIDAQRRIEAAERNKKFLEEKAEKNSAVKARQAAGKAAAPKIAEQDLNKASMVYTAKGIGSIFIGKKANAYDVDHLKECGITRVLNCAKEIEIPDFYKKKRIGWHKLECEDKSSFPIDEFFDDGVEYIRKCVEDEKLKVLVHCQEGRSRSTSMVVAYLIRYHKLHVDSALATISARRSLVQPNSGFLEKLRDYEKVWFKGSKEEEEVEGAKEKTDDAKEKTDDAKEKTDVAKEKTDDAKAADADAEKAGVAGVDNDEFEFES